jgi:hypothetical protein
MIQGPSGKCLDLTSFRRTGPWRRPRDDYQPTPVSSSQKSNAGDSNQIRSSHSYLARRGSNYYLISHDTHPCRASLNACRTAILTLPNWNASPRKEVLRALRHERSAMQEA